MLGIDANARVGSNTLQFVGKFEACAENDNVAHFCVFLDSASSYACNTFAESWDAWVCRRWGATARIDYVCSDSPYDPNENHVRVEHAIDLTTTSEDGHRAVR